MKTEALIEIDDLGFVAGLLVELARENKKGRMEITPAQMRELVALTQVAKKVIIRCISVQPETGKR